VKCDVKFEMAGDKRDDCQDYCQQKQTCKSIPDEDGKFGDKKQKRKRKDKYMQKSKYTGGPDGFPGV
jgi:hypothetical protein